jgi:hypothetical protein
VLSGGPPGGPVGGPPGGPVGGPPGGHPAPASRRDDPALHAACGRSAGADIHTHRLPRVSPNAPSAGSPASIALGASTIATPPARQRSFSRRPRPLRRERRRHRRGATQGVSARSRKAPDGGPHPTLDALMVMDPGRPPPADGFAQAPRRVGRRVGDEAISRTVCRPRTTAAPTAPASGSPIVAPASIPASPGCAVAPDGPRLRLGFRDRRRARFRGCGCRSNDNGDHDAGRGSGGR